MTLVRHRVIKVDGEPKQVVVDMLRRRGGPGRSRVNRLSRPSARSRLSPAAQMA